MPYIDQKDRPAIEDAVEQVSGAVKALGPEKLDGAFNYAVTRLVVKLFGKMGYSNFVRVAGGLEEVKAEYRRRIVAPYENMKNDQNGDVYGVER